MNSFDRFFIKKLDAYLDEMLKDQLDNLPYRHGIEEYQFRCGYIRALRDVIDKSEDIIHELNSPSVSGAGASVKA